MQEHLGVEAGRQALLLLELVVVEVGIEVGNLLLRDVAALHAVVEDNTSSGIMVHSLLMLALGLSSDGADTHSLLLRVWDAKE